MNTCEHLCATARLLPDRVALRFEGATYSYEALSKLSARAAAMLAGMGVGPGDRVALWMPNTPGFVVWYYAVLQIGSVPVSLSSRLTTTEATAIIGDSGAVAVVGPTESLGAITESLPACVNSVVAVDSSGQPIDTRLPDRPYEGWVDSNPGDLALILYTSGTTGVQKGAMLSHGNVRSNVAAFNHLCGMRPGDRIFLAVPLFHCFGQNALLNSGLHAGATLVLQRQFDPEATRKLIVTEKITQLYGVPSMFRVLCQTCDPSELASVRYCFSAAAPLAPDLSREWLEKFGLPIHEGYGLTETSPFATYNHRLCYELGSIGTPIDGVEVRVIDPESGHECQTGELGEIAIRGPNVMLGYWNRPEETAEAIRDGWFFSGDIGRRDERGYLYVVDRVKDMIAVGGLKVYPAEIERVLLDHPRITQAAVVGTPEPTLGERVVAFVVGTAGDSPNEQQESLNEELLAICRERLADYKRPSQFVWIDELPRNPGGKVLKRALRQRLLPSGPRSRPGSDSKARQNRGLLNRLSSAYDSDREGIIQQFIIDLMRPLVPQDVSLTPDTGFVGAGLDSLQLVELAGYLEQELPEGRKLTAMSVFEHPRVRDLATFVVGELSVEGAAFSGGDSVRPIGVRHDATTQTDDFVSISAMSDAEASEALRLELEDC